MKVKVPKQIKIGSHTYAVMYRYHLGKDEGFRGTIEHRPQEIHIDPINPLSQRNVTLLHECIHLITTVWSVGLDDDAIDRIAEGLGELLYNNFGIELDWSDIGD